MRRGRGDYQSDRSQIGGYFLLIQHMFPVALLITDLAHLIKIGGILEKGERVIVDVLLVMGAPPRGSRVHVVHLDMGRGRLFPYQGI